MYPETQNFSAIGWSVFGLAVALVGLVWLVAGSWLRPRGRRYVALGLACLSGVAAATAYALDQPTWLWQPLLALSPLGLVIALACSKVPAHAGPFLFRLVTCAPVQALVLLVSGLAVAGNQLWRIDSDLQSEMDRTETELALASEPADLEVTPNRPAFTDSGHQIQLFSPRTAAQSDQERAAERRYLQQNGLEMKVIQTAGLNPNYNCHGWVFAGGRFWVRSVSVDRILQDNGYKPTTAVAPGDVAVFRNKGGKVTHSGLVHSVSQAGLILVESKWGRLGRFIHTDANHLYRTDKVNYYRSPRRNHLLQGLYDDTPSSMPSDIVADRRLGL